MIYKDKQTEWECFTVWWVTKWLPENKTKTEIKISLTRYHTTNEHRQKVKKEKLPSGSLQNKRENFSQPKRWTKENEVTL